MQKLILFALSTILTMSATAFGDVKVKSKQTVSGQTTENTTYIKGKRQRIEMMNGVMVTITQCDLSRDLQLNPGTKTYVVSLYDDGTPNTQPNQPAKSSEITKGGTMYVTTTIKDTGERKQMFGYTARHIVQTIETDTSADACYPTKSKMEMDMWVIDDEFGLACTQTRQYRPNNNGGRSGGCKDKIVPKTIGSAKSGYPVYQKMTSLDANGKETLSMIQEVTEFSKATLEDALFDVPSDYREVQNASQMYAAASGSGSGSSSGIGDSGGSNGSTRAPSSGLSSSIKNGAAPRNDAPAAVGAKKPGVVRIGLAGVKTTAAGEGINPAELSTAIQNSLADYLKGTKVEVVPLEAKLSSAVTDEAKQKECDYVVYATVAHKKGGGGMGFGKMLGQVVGQTGIGHTGSVAGNIAGQMATTAIVAASLSGNVKSKDELTLDLTIKPTADGGPAVTKQFKSKARSDGEDIISPTVEQAAQAILDAAAK